MPHRTIPALSAKQIARFNRYVKDRPDEGCWLWIGHKNGSGHGMFNVGQHEHAAHRVAYHMAHGNIPDAHSVRHTCGQPDCVRPSHLELSRPHTAAERKALAKERQARYMAKPEARAKKAQYKKEYDLSNQSRNRDHHLRKSYGITLAEWEDLYASQGKVCAICGEDKRRMTVDHDHETGNVRGILCITCNLQLRILEDEIQLARALTYLRTYPQHLYDEDVHWHYLSNDDVPKYDIIAQSVWESLSR